jgi:hypothetical protein
MPKLGIIIFGCLTVPKYREQIEDCYATWVKDALEVGCIVRFYTSTIPEDIEPELAKLCVNVYEYDGYFSATFKQWRGFQHMYTTFEPCNFYFTCGTDTFLNIKNALKVLEPYSPTKNYQLGGLAVEEQLDGKVYSYFSGGAGIFVSRATMDYIVPKIDEFIPWWLSVAGVYKETVNPDGTIRMNSLLFACDLALGVLCTMIDAKNVCVGEERMLGSGNHKTPGIKLNDLISCHNMLHDDFYEYYRMIYTDILSI